MRKRLNRKYGIATPLPPLRPGVAGLFASLGAVVSRVVLTLEFLLLVLPIGLVRRLMGKGCSVIVNTSFNVRGEPIVCTPEDAYRCFMLTEMDYLVMGDSLFAKEEQPAFEEARDWRKEFALD